VIYIEDKTQEMQFELIEKIAFAKKFELVFWLYQEYKKSEFLGLPVSPELQGEAVTTYGNGSFPYNTLRIECNASTIGLMKQNKKTIEENCDSIVLYEPASHDWYLCTIGHEGMSLIRDDSVMNELSSNGFQASLEAPEWW